MLCLVAPPRLGPVLVGQVSHVMVGALLRVEAWLQVSCCCPSGDYLVQVG